MKKYLVFLFFALVFLSACKKMFEVGTPQNVHASISGKVLTVTWSAVSGAEKYHVFEKLEGYMSTGGQFLERVENPTSPVFTRTFDWSPDGTTYTYQICAEKDGRFSSYGTSNSVKY